MLKLDSLANARITIFGLGLMGGSLAMSLKGSCTSIYGIDPDPSAVAYANEHKIVDRASVSPQMLLPQTNFVILAAPVGTIIKLIQALPELHPGKAVVLDIGSTKVDIVREMENLPSRFDPVGGHPMCGKEKISLINAEPGLFQNATFAFTMCKNSTHNAQGLAEQLAYKVGANPVWLDAHTHDKWASATSHFPYLLASALSLSTPTSAAPLVGPGFRSTTRIAATPVSLMLDIFATNQANILDSLDTFREQLDQIRLMLATKDYSSLQAIMERSASHQKNITSGEVD
jgi:prephenate dehydrogenase